MYGQREYTLLPLLADSAATRSSDEFPLRYGEADPFTGVLIRVNVANRGGTSTYTPKIVWKTPTGALIDFWVAGAAIAADGNFYYLIHPHAPTTPSGILTAVAQLPLPPRCIFTLTYGGSGDSDTLAEAFVIP